MEGNVLFAYSTAKKHLLARPDYKQVGLNITTIAVNIGTYAMVARVLGASTFGTYSFLQWLATITVPLIGVGMSAITSNQLVRAHNKETPFSIAGMFYFLWYYQCRRIVLYSVIYLALAFLSFLLFPMCSPLRLVLSGLATLPLFLNGIIGVTLRSLRRQRLLASVNLFGALITLLFTIIASQLQGQQPELFLLVLALSGTFTLMLSVICIARQLPLQEAQKPGFFLSARLHHCCRLPFVSYGIDAIIWQHSEILLLAYWYSSQELGLYTVSMMISATIIRLVPGLLTSWILPVFLRHQQGPHYLDPYDSFIKTSCYMAFLAAPICILVTLISPTLITYCLGYAYLPLLQPLRILLIASVFGSIATVSLTRLAHSERQKTLQQIGMASALINIVLAIPCIAHWGMEGAAFASASAQIIAALGSIILCARLLLKNEINFT
ncbi:MAG TPA: polysaccharide biosynthesis C-terminal domain-containing protein [Ktedonobacteraceae bacterium]|nr:polysaccharide biosynthesis C-terminal domain-containing protein [Ktedonobacteraceae bacterium]